jgi:glycosyltransferase involved in cell wall biosynthesis
MSRRIALISEHASPLCALGGVDSGGQNVYVAQVARHLARMGYRVDVFTRRDDPKLPVVADLGQGVRVIHVDAGPACFVPKEEMLPYIDDFADWMIEFMLGQGGYEIVHANFFMSGIVAMRLQRALAIPFAVTFHALGLVRLQHQGGIDRFPRERGRLEAEVMSADDAIIAECPQDMQDQVELYDADPAKITIVPCGFDRDELWPVQRAAARRHLGLVPEQRLVVHIGRMVPRKGVDTAIEGFARLIHRHGIDARLLVVGGEADEPDPALTPEIGRLMEIARQEQVVDHVTFTGRRQRRWLRYFYSAADVFVTTPWYEPFGITPVEAMACGTPVIGSNVGGIKYTVRHCRTGFLVSPNDAEAIGMRLAQLYRRPRLLQRMRRAAIERANERFTWQRVAQEIADVLEGVLERRTATFNTALSIRPLRSSA